ncbi:MAG: amylo-alpha-1,6-glucosidase, partial [Trueperaceae bacterium]|nr:amylo-alpha-1,6-glucosidase [Trueperaceae bacterium]
PIRFGRATCGDGETAERLEWLVTNGIGGYASGTVSGIRTRKYHGLLVAATDPPAGRTVLATDVHESLRGDRQEIALHASRWRGDVVDPQGYVHHESFALAGRVPVWRVCVGPMCIEKRVAMAPGRNVTVIGYRAVRAAGPVRLMVKVLVSRRDFHATLRAGAAALTAEREGEEVWLRGDDGAPVLRIGGEGMGLAPVGIWYEGFLLARERDRGLDHLDDAFQAATASVELAEGEEAYLTLAADPDPVAGAAVFRQVAGDDAAVVARYAERHGALADPVGARLALAADQFVVRRRAGARDGPSVIAGYPWFADWGRDTMIALPGLALAAGRPELARDLLTSYAAFVDGGMLPNRFPDAGGDPAYNTVDATLWYLEALRAYVAETDDLDLVRELWPTLLGIVAAHDRGTRYGICVDPGDGLLRAGAAGTQLTWMDAKVGDWVVTPRIGKPVEVNALWFNGLVALRDLAARIGEPSETWAARASQVEASLQRFWNPRRGHLFDVLEGPDGHDPSLRPNQLFAVSLPASAFDAERQRAVVDACAGALLTSHGLRSLAPDHPDYRPRYGGGVLARDGAYHQGTVWAWLLGPFALAHHRVHGDAQAARSFLEPLVDQLHTHGVGSLAEIFDGEAPHLPRGCFAQAWSVAETLRAWTRLAELAAGAASR